jgi:hypothetical protein
MCGSHGFRTFLSAGGRYNAVLYEYDCGATTDFGTHIALISGREKFDPYAAEDTALLFTADSDHQHIDVDLQGILPVEIRWKDNFHLEVNVPRKARVFKEMQQIGPISISYAMKDFAQ